MKMSIEVGDVFWNEKDAKNLKKRKIGSRRLST